VRAAALIVGGLILSDHKDRVSEAKSRGEPEKRDCQKKDFANREGMDAD
jgi:hypothetical protein